MQTSSINEDEIKQRISELKQFRQQILQQPNNTSKLENNQRMISYYEKLLQQLSPVLKPEIQYPSFEQSTTSSTSDTQFYHTPIFNKPKSPIKTTKQDQIEYPTFENEESSLQNIQQTSTFPSVEKDYVSPVFFYRPKDVNYYPKQSKPSFSETLQTLFTPEQWGPAYDLIAVVVEKLVPTKQQNKETIEIPDDGDEKEVADVLNEMNKELKDEEESLKSSSSEMDLEQLEKEIEQRNEMTPEQELVELEEEIQKEEIAKQLEKEKQVLTSTYSLSDSYEYKEFLIETKYKEDFENLKKGWHEAVNIVRNIPKQKFITSEDKLVSQKKTETGAEFVFSSGIKVTLNSVTGLTRIEYPNGVIIHRRANGDQRKTIPQDKIEFFDRKQLLYSIKYLSSKSEVAYIFHYLRSGASVKQYRDGTKLQILPNGNKALFLKDGLKEVLYKTGVKQINYPNGVQEVILNGKRYIKQQQV